jgi:prolyl-tRNA editing enzyme YbaK/EbsC (Cys-tRNA(Pro) deacylase)
MTMDDFPPPDDSSPHHSRWCTCHREGRPLVVHINQIAGYAWPEKDRAQADQTAARRKHRSMNDTLSASVRKVQAALDALNLPCQVVELPASTRTAQEAADAIGTTVGQIIKSLVFRKHKQADLLLVWSAAATGADENLLAALLGEPIKKADADFVRQQTGFAIGGCHRSVTNMITTLIDQDLLLVWRSVGCRRDTARGFPSRPAAT